MSCRPFHNSVTKEERPSVLSEIITLEHKGTEPHKLKSKYVASPIITRYKTGMTNNDNDKLWNEMSKRDKRRLSFGHVVG